MYQGTPVRSVLLVLLLCLGIVRGQGFSDGTATPPDGGGVTVSVDALGGSLGTVVTGGGTTFTGCDTFAEAASPGTYVRDLRALPSSLNRIHYNAETPDDRSQSELRFPQPNAPPAAWSLTYLEEVVKIARRVRDNGGPDFILVCHNCPRWMAQGNQQGMKPADDRDWARSCSSLVSYFNLGYFIDEAGRRVENPNGTLNRINFWETWCEPDINDSGGRGLESPSFTPQEFANCFQVVSRAMRAVDPTIRIGGPSTSENHQAFLDALAQKAQADSQVRLDFLSYHSYLVDLEDTDAQGFEKGKRVLWDNVLLRSFAVPDIFRALPVYCDEMNVDGAETDPRNASASPYEMAYLPVFNIADIEQGVNGLVRYQNAGWEPTGPSWDLFNVFTGQTTRNYWVQRLFWGAVVPGAGRLPWTSSSADVVCLPLVKDGKLVIVVVNKGVASASDRNGSGTRHQVTIQGLPIGSYDTQVVDRDSSPSAAPAITSVVGVTSVTLTIDGYGMATVRQQEGSGNPVPSITSPSAGSTLTGSSVTFQWSAASGATRYWLYIGRTVGAHDLLDSGSLGTSLSVTAAGLPTDGSRVWVRLWYLHAGAWSYVDASFTAATLASGDPVITNPAAGSVLTSSAATFTWSAGTGVTRYWLYIGRTVGAHDLLDSGSLGQSLSATATGLPTDGSPVWVRLWYLRAGAWSFVDVGFTAATLAIVDAVITNPVAGSVLASSTVTFTWSAGTGVARYWLYIGRTVGAHDLLDSGNLGTSLSATAAGLPTDGSQVWVRLWYLRGGVWLYVDAAYLATIQ